jgi:nucleoside-diphosphate-sugar epimerase
MKKIVVIGSSGFLGRHLLEELKSREVQVYAVKHKNPIKEVDHNFQISGGIKSINDELIDKINPDVIFHLARPVMPRFKKWGRKLAALKATRLNRNLLKNLNKSTAKPLLVFASGSLMYGNSSNPHLEDSPLNPVSFARQYFKGELPIVEAANSGTYPVQVFRLPWLLGNGSWFRWFYLENIRKSKSIPKFGDGKNHMEIIDVRDAVKLMAKIAFGSEIHGIINLPSLGAITQQQFLEKISEALHARIVDFKKLYPGRLEVEVFEAYTSSIVLGTKYPKLFDDFEYSGLEDSLNRLKNV